MRSISVEEVYKAAASLLASDKIRAGTLPGVRSVPDVYKSSRISVGG
jgi:hypothetical protein